MCELFWSRAPLPPLPHLRRCTHAQCGWGGAGERHAHQERSSNAPTVVNQEELPPTAVMLP